MALLSDLLALLWTDYATITPQAARAHELLRARGEEVRHDHLALATFDLPEVDIDALERAFVAEGYEPAQSYQFPDEKLIAYHYEHREGDRWPRLLIAAVLVDELSARAQEIARELVAQTEPGAAAHPGFAASGRPWEVTSAAHEALRCESELAAWVAAFGFRASHFSLDAGALRTFAGLGELGRFLEDSGVLLDHAGGVVKGSPGDLEQIFTAPDEVEVELSDRSLVLPSCTYELARRTPPPDGALYQGLRFRR